jgi:REP-associated tyrosine transposase
VHVRGADDALVKVASLLELVNDWRLFLETGISEQEAEMMRRHERTGRPLGQEGFISKLETTLGRILRPQKPGRKKKEN